MRFQTFACERQHLLMAAPFLEAARYRACASRRACAGSAPVCGTSVASLLFIDAAATPPHEEGNAPRLNHSRIRSQAHRRPLQTICWYRFFCYTPLEHFLAFSRILAGKAKSLVEFHKSRGCAG